VVGLLYGSGLRLMEALRLRVQDLDFERRELTVRNGKGGKDRRTLLPGSQYEALKQHLETVRRLHQQDLEAGWGAVVLPHALERKYRHANRHWGWQGFFLSETAGRMRPRQRRDATTWIRVRSKRR